MKLNKPHELVYPSVVPAGILSLLASVGLNTTNKVHGAIRDGTLQEHRGIGPARERIIRHYYTTDKITYTTTEAEKQIKTLERLYEACESENEKLKTTLSNIILNSIDMGDYYYVEYEAIEAAITIEID